MGDADIVPFVDSADGVDYGYSDTTFDFGADSVDLWV